jgi:hypothetical protein
MAKFRNLRPESTKGKIYIAFVKGGAKAALALAEKFGKREVYRTNRWLKNNGAGFQRINEENKARSLKAAKKTAKKPAPKTKAKAPKKGPALLSKKFPIANKPKKKATKKTVMPQIGNLSSVGTAPQAVAA